MSGHRCSICGVEWARDRAHLCGDPLDSLGEYGPDHQVVDALRKLEAAENRIQALEAAIRSHKCCEVFLANDGDNGLRVGDGADLLAVLSTEATP